ncbi:hypothetical protein E2C01_029795 [Portunus trituberculatus]|uniref:Uncharacterized protein n=1 Tax=Portunus trituberculatus TaxID=210409 RepID=A0A5B7ENU7_PORTR|nr:hypothetical protein [Portunus trituberculatus]
MFNPFSTVAHFYHGFCGVIRRFYLH